MKRLFISQPMRGRSDKEILNERAAAIKKAEEILGEEVEVIESYFEHDNSPKGACKPLWFLGKSIQLLSTADVVFFCDGWQNARGCRVERRCAYDYDLEMLCD